MAKRVLMLNALLVAIAASFAAYIVWELTRPPLTATPPRARAVPATPATAPAPVEAQPPSPGGYAIIASRNLFSPSRSDAPVTAATGAPVMPAVKLTLYGVVLRDGAPLAYLEDPTTKRVTGYRVGDTLAGGTVTTIAADRVVVARPEGTVDVRLHDPTKARPAVGTPAAPGMPAVPGAPVPPRRLGPVPPVAPPGAGAGPVVQPPPTSPVFPPSRRRPPLLRRGPGAPTGPAAPSAPGVPSDGTSR